MTNAQRYLVGKPEEQTTLEDERIGEKIMIKYLFKNRMEQGATDSSD